jgi:hypothetical protein
MVNPVSSAQNYSKHATQVDEHRQKQNQQAARVSKDASGGNAAGGAQLVTNQPKANSTQNSTNAAAVAKNPPQAQQPASQPQKPNTYSSIDIRA